MQHQEPTWIEDSGRDRVSREVSGVGRKWIGCALEGEQVPNPGSPRSPQSGSTSQPHALTARLC